MSSARETHEKIVPRRKPFLKFPLGSFSNVRDASRRGTFGMLDKTGERTREDIVDHNRPTYPRRERLLP